MKKICEYCNKEFDNRNKNQRFCSRSCKSKSQDRSNIIQYDRNGNKNPNWKGNKMMKVCPYCDQTFRAKRITQTYCSKKCWRKSLSEEFKEGRAAFLNSFIENPSKPQIELYELTKKLFSNSILNYQLECYSIDIAIPNLKIAIEYDGSYWHQDKEKDIERQKNIENFGWSFIRYVDYIPSKNELKKDIMGVI